MRTLILTRAEVRALLEPAKAIEAVRAAFAAHARGETSMPPKVYIPLPQHNGDFRAMPAYSSDGAGVKWINAHPDNPTKHGLPSVIGVFVYSDPATAVPLAIMDATEMTAMRTGAAAAVATRALARPGVASLGMIGCGVQARTLVSCHRIVMSCAEIMLYDRSRAAAEALATELADLPCRVAELEEAAAADVVCTTTPSRTPILEQGMIGPGSHVNAMGADAPGKQELDERILLDARIFVDDMEQADESGEVNVPLRTGVLRREQIAGTIGDVLTGKLAGRLGSEITVFDSTGLAVQDLAVARTLYERARSAGVGLEVDLVGV